MVPSSVPDIVALGPGDSASAMELSREAGWNQTEDDWRLFVDLGEAFAIERDGMLAATAAIMPYGSDLAWISMVLTRRRFRGQGFGTALLNHCLGRLHELGRVSLLEATSLGEPLYRKLGFHPRDSWTRWQGQSAGGIRPRCINDRDRAIARDRQAFGVDRSDMLTRLVDRTGFCLSTESGSCFLRDGDRAWQIGPIVARTPTGALELLTAALETVDGEVFIDVPDQAHEMIDRLAGHGFQRQRGFLRMVHGTPPVKTSDWQHYALAGPELG